MLVESGGPASYQPCHVAIEAAKTHYKKELLLIYKRVGSGGPEQLLTAVLVENGEREPAAPEMATEAAKTLREEPLLTAALADRCEQEPVPPETARDRTAAPLAPTARGMREPAPLATPEPALPEPRGPAQKTHFKKELMLIIKLVESGGPQPLTAAPAEGGEQEPVPPETARSRLAMPLAPAARGIQEPMPLVKPGPAQPGPRGPARRAQPLLAHPRLAPRPALAQRARQGSRPAQRRWEQEMALLELA